MRGRKILFAYIVAALLYIALTFIILPPDANTMQRYSLSVTQVRLLNAALVVPLMFIWAAAFYGYAKLRRYSDTIKTSAEGRSVSLITNGIMIQAFGLPITSIVNKVLRYVGQQHDALLTPFTIATNYVSLLFPLVAFVLIGIGANGLTSIRKQRTARLSVHAMIILFALLSVTYTYFVIHFAFSGDPSAGSIYQMPLWLVLVTLVVPYIYTWFIGVLAAYEMFAYNAKLKGIIYRKSWSRVSIGLGIVILSQVLVQCFTTLTRQLTQLHVGTIFGLAYGLLLIMAVGYIILALGMKKLQRIEEI